MSDKREIRRIIINIAVKLFLWCIPATLFFYLAAPHVANPDGTGYYAHLRSFFIDGDFVYWNEFRAMRINPDFLRSTEEGFASNHWALGTPMLWAPWFALGHLEVRLLNSAGIPVRNDGFSFIHQYSTLYGTWFCGMAAFIMVYYLIKNSGTETSLVPITAVFLGSPFIFYLLRSPSMPHICSVFAVSLLLSLWLKITKNPPIPRIVFYLGLSAGLAVAVRTQNIFFLVLPASLIFHKKFRSFSLKRKLFFAAAFVFGFLSILTPQLIVWKTLYGSFFKNPQVSFMEWTSPNIISVLFSAYHGLFFWSPALFAGLLGLAFFAYKRPGLGIPMALVFLMQLYVNSAYALWWGTGSFGGRRFLNCLPLFALGAVYLRNKTNKKAFDAIQGLSALWTILLFLSHMGVERLVDYETPRELFLLQKETLFSLPSQMAEMITRQMYNADAKKYIMPPVALMGALGLWTVRVKSRDPFFKRNSRLLPAALIALLFVMNIFVAAAGLRSKKIVSRYAAEAELYSLSDSASGKASEMALYLGRSELAAAAGDWNEAEEMLLKALQFYPEHPDLKRRLREVRRELEGNSNEKR